MSVIFGTDNGCPDRKTLYIKVAQNSSTITNTLLILPPHPSNIPNIEPPPLRTVCPMICLVLLKYPDEFISNTKVVRNSSTNPDTPLLSLSDVHDTSGMIPSPPVTLSGNHPEPVVHPRMNSRSEQRALHCVRTPLAFHTSCHASVCYDCLYLLCLSPFIFR